jgi:photosystem II stability/assembly factor-like uncharacterized protein
MIGNRISPPNAAATTRSVVAVALLLGQASIVFAEESPQVAVSIDSNSIIYTATPSFSSAPGFKPHINFPYMKRRADGSLIVDATVGQTQSGLQFGIRSFSGDNGATWVTLTSGGGTSPNSSIILPPGQTSFGVNYAMSSSTGLTSWTNTRYRSTDGAYTWTPDTAFFDTGSIAYTSVYNNLTDIVRSGSTLLTTAYGTRAAVPGSEAILLASTDNGQHWTRRATIATQNGSPDMGSEGPSESSLIKLNDGRLLSVFRTGQPFPSNNVSLVSPSLFVASSVDDGLTWTTPKSLGVAGVFPLLRKLDDGTVALTFGRYGAKVMFADATGKRWTAPTVLYNGPTSGHTELRPTNDGKFAFVHDQSSFYNPSYNASPPAGYVYNNDQSANLRLLKLSISRGPSSDDHNWATEFHADDLPENVGQGWTLTNTSTVAFRNARVELGRDFVQADTATTIGGKQLFWTAGSNWQPIDFASAGVTIDIGMRVTSTYAVNAGSASIEFADGVGLGTLNITGTDVSLDGQGSRVRFLESANPGFSTSDWHRYRIVVKPLVGATTSLVANVFLDDNLTTPILTQPLAATSLRQLRFGDLVLADNSIADYDFIRFSAEVGQWSGADGAAWTQLANWTTRVPNGVDAVARFVGGTTPQSVALDTPVSAGRLTLSGVGYSIAGLGSLRLETSAGSALVQASGGSHAIDVPVTLASPTQLSVDAGSTLTLRSVNGAALSITGTVVMASGRSADRTSVVSALSITSGQLRLGDNDFVVDYAGASPIASIRQYLQSGLISCDAPFSVGYVEGASTSMLLRRTLAGDADLNGIVNFDDLLRLAANYNAAGRYWSEGDFNYDGTVNFDDLLLLAARYNQQAGAIAARMSIVPEPSVVALAFAVLLRRARKSS